MINVKYPRDGFQKSLPAPVLLAAGDVFGYAYYGRYLFLLQDRSAVVMKKELTLRWINKKQRVD